LYELVKLTPQVHATRNQYPAENAARALSSVLSAAERSFFFARDTRKSGVDSGPSSTWNLIVHHFPLTKVCLFCLEGCLLALPNLNAKLFTAATKPKIAAAALSRPLMHVCPQAIKLLDSVWERRM